jgi:hypothetical protein
VGWLKVCASELIIVKLQTGVFLAVFRNFCGMIAVMSGGLRLLNQKRFHSGLNTHDSVKKRRATVKLLKDTIIVFSFTVRCQSRHSIGESNALLTVLSIRSVGDLIDQLPQTYAR